MPDCCCRDVAYLLVVARDYSVEVARHPSPHVVRAAACALLSSTSHVTFSNHVIYR